MKSKFAHPYEAKKKNKRGREGNRICIRTFLPSLPPDLFARFFISRFSFNSLLFDLEIDGRRLSEILSNLATSEVGPFREDGRCGVGWEGPNGEPEAACDPG